MTKQEAKNIAEESEALVQANLLSAEKKIRTAAGKGLFEATINLRNHANALKVSQLLIEAGFKSQAYEDASIWISWA